MKTILSLAVFVVALQAQAMVPSKPIVCKVPNVQDASMVLTIYPNPKAKVSPAMLFVPNGEASGDSINGKCTRVEGAIEFAMTCSFISGMESGYDANVGSLGGSEIVASVIPWNMSGPETPVRLTCD